MVPAVDRPGEKVLMEINGPFTPLPLTKEGKVVLSATYSSQLVTENWKPADPAQ